SRPEDPGMSTATLSDAERVGAGLAAENGALKVMAVIDGLPAERAGVRAGDLIVAIDGASLAARSSFRSVHDALANTQRESLRLRVRRGLAFQDVVLKKRVSQSIR